MNITYKSFSNKTFFPCAQCLNLLYEINSLKTHESELVKESVSQKGTHIGEKLFTFWLWCACSSTRNAPPPTANMSPTSGASFFTTLKNSFSALWIVPKMIGTIWIFLPKTFLKKKRDCDKSSSSGVAILMRWLLQMDLGAVFIPKHWQSSEQNLLCIF